MTLEELYNQRCAAPSDINEHLPTLRHLAVACDHVTEFGVRSGNSTVALLMGLGGRIGTHMVSYDIALHSLPVEVALRKDWTFVEADTAKLRDIAETDLLFVDSLHTFEHVAAELRHESSVKRYIVLHDTVLFGERGEDGGPGICRAILSLLSGNQWQILYNAKHNNGLMVLSRR